MKRKIGILLAVLTAMVPMANAVIVNIEVGDRPYLYPWTGLLRWSRLLGLDSGTLGLASPSQSLDSRSLRTALISGFFDRRLAFRMTGAIFRRALDAREGWGIF